MNLVKLVAVLVLCTEFPAAAKDFPTFGHHRPGGPHGFKPMYWNPSPHSKPGSPSELAFSRARDSARERANNERSQRISRVVNELLKRRLLKFDETLAEIEKFPRQFRDDKNTIFANIHKLPYLLWPTDVILSRRMLTQDEVDAEIRKFPRSQRASEDRIAANLKRLPQIFWPTNQLASHQIGRAHV